jgi:hypothetical protein
MSEEDKKPTYDEAVWAMLVSNRGTPTTCDFCGLPYSEERWPVPEEGRAWSCNECEAESKSDSHDF